MSVLSFPRIYFNGYMGWDPPTANNNDYQPIYDAANAALDWDYLASKGITPENFKEKFRPWDIRPDSDTCPPAAPGVRTVDTCSDCTPPPDDQDTCHMGSRWDYFGGGGSWFVDYQDFKTLSTGGDLDYQRPAQPGDAILGKPVTISGNTFGGRQSYTRLIDTNPQSPWSSQVFFANIKLGDDTTSISGPPAMRMHSRAFAVPRSFGPGAPLIIAGAIGVIFQATFPFPSLEFSGAGNSPLLAALRVAMQLPGAQGLMLRMSVYNTLYYQNGTFNDFPVARNCDELTRMYQAGQVFMNPAYSRVAGVFGVWNRGELSTMPGGFYLTPSSPMAPTGCGADGAAPETVSYFALGGHQGGVFKKAGGDSPPPTWGPAFAELNAAKGLLSIDLINTIPDCDLNGTKYNYGPIEVGVCLPAGSNLCASFRTLGTIPYSQYSGAAYFAKAGIVDAPLPQGVSVEDVRRMLQTGGRLALRAQQSGTPTVACLERKLTAQTDQRGVYLDECRIATFTVQVRQGDGPPPAGTRVLLAQYYPWPLKVGSGQWVLFGSEPPPGGTNPRCNVKPAAPYVEFVGGDTVPVTIPPGADYGEATVRLKYLNPGFPIVAFYPFVGARPTPQPQVVFGFQTLADYTIGNAFYSTVRTMPRDNALLGPFVQAWNGKYDRTEIWKFVYGNVLYVYDMLYPVMDQFVPLGNLGRVEGAIDQLLALIEQDWVDGSTLYMPVTRELSAAKRLILQAWGGLVKQKYPKRDLPPLQVPCDF
jgi:hypothetical protein